jgi:hypothetical protein
LEDGAEQYWGQLDAAKAQTEAAERQVKYSESALNGVRNSWFGVRTPDGR